MSSASTAPGEATVTAWARKSGIRRSRSNRPAVGVRVGAHPPEPLRGERGQVGQQPPGLIEQFVGFVTAHPAVELFDVSGMLLVDEQRHLMGPERALDLQAVDDLRSGPALR